MALSIDILITFGEDLHNPQITTYGNTFSQGHSQQTIHNARRRACGGNQYESIIEVHTRNQFSSFVPRLDLVLRADQDHSNTKPKCSQFAKPINMHNYK